MKNSSRILIFIAVIVGMIAAEINVFGINEYKKEIIIGLLGLVLIDFSISTIKRYRAFMFLQTKFDLFFRLANLTVGIVAIGFLIPNWVYFFDFGWILLLFGFLGLFSGIAYQNSIQIRKKTSDLIIKYKHRNEKVIQNFDTLVYGENELTIGDGQRLIEINDIKNTERNTRLVVEFFKGNYPELELEIR